MEKEAAVLDEQEVESLASESRRQDIGANETCADPWLSAQGWDNLRQRDDQDRASRLAEGGGFSALELAAVEKKANLSGPSRSGLFPHM